MDKAELNVEHLLSAAQDFCKKESNVPRKELFAVTDGKAIGTFVEHLFQSYLADRYTMTVGSSSNGLDLPSINTDIKVTSIHRPQSSSPYKDSKQKIYGLGYNLIIFVYAKSEDVIHKTSSLDFVSCFFIEASRTADYQTTTGLLNIIKNNGNADDIFAFLCDHKIPADEVTLMQMAEQILKNPPPVGYLTVSSALQWRLQYTRVVLLEDDVDGVSQIVRYR